MKVELMLNYIAMSLFDIYTFTKTIGNSISEEVRVKHLMRELNLK